MTHERYPYNGTGGLVKLLRTSIRTPTAATHPVARACVTLCASRRIRTASNLAKGVSISSRGLWGVPSEMPRRRGWGSVPPMSGADMWGFSARAGRAGRSGIKVWRRRQSSKTSVGGGRETSQLPRAGCFVPERDYGPERFPPAWKPFMSQRSHKCRKAVAGTASPRDR